MPTAQRATAPASAVIGVADHAGWAIFMTVAPDGSLLDRRRVELVDDDLPCLPHHSEGQRLPLSEAVALVERVRESAEQHARLCLDAVRIAVPQPIAGIALRLCPSLPDTIEARLTNYRAQNVADTVMYRQALAEAAIERGWSVHWYDAKRVFGEAAAVLQLGTIDELLDAKGRELGPPWQKDHRTAMAAAIAAAGGR